MAHDYAAGLQLLLKEQDAKMKRLRMLLEDVRLAHVDGHSIVPLLGAIEDVRNQTADLDRRVKAYIRKNRVKTV